MNGIFLIPYRIWDSWGKKRIEFWTTSNCWINPFYSNNRRSTLFLFFSYLFRSFSLRIVFFVISPVYGVKAEFRFLELCPFNVVWWYARYLKSEKRRKNSTTFDRSVNESMCVHQNLCACEMLSLWDYTATGCLCFCLSHCLIIEMCEITKLILSMEKSRQKKTTLIDKRIRPQRIEKISVFFLVVVVVVEHSKYLFIFITVLLFERDCKF